MNYGTSNRIPVLAVSQGPWISSHCHDVCASRRTRSSGAGENSLLLSTELLSLEGGGHLSMARSGYQQCWNEEAVRSCSACHSSKRSHVESPLCTIYQHLPCMLRTAHTCPISGIWPIRPAYLIRGLHNLLITQCLAYRTNTQNLGCR